VVTAVTFYDGAHTYWHVHHGSCQILLATAGEGYVQIWGEPVRVFHPGDSFTVPEGTKHWHGAAPGHTFQHVAVMERKDGVWTEWGEEVQQPAR
jgi:quercetin dioxygenase-like cupin family protein